MKPHLQCAEQLVSLSNLPKYCACHEKWHGKISKKMFENRWNVISNAGPIRPWSEHAPRMKPLVRNPPRKWGYFSSSPGAFSIEKYNVSRPILHSNIHQILCLPRKVTLALHQVLHLPRKVTLDLHQILRLPRKVTLELHQILRLSRRKTFLLNHDYIWNLIYNARSNRCPGPTSPNTAPVTKKDSHTASSSHMKPHLQCAEQPVSYQTSPNIAPATQKDSLTATGVTSKPHQILRLSRKKTHILSPHHIWNLIYSARSNRCHHPTSPNTAPVTRKDSHSESSWHMKPHLQCAEQPVSPSNLTKILRLSRRKTHILSPHHIWNLIDNVRSNRCHHPTSPNNAPVTQKDSHT